MRLIAIWQSHRSAMQSGSLWPSRPTCKRPAWSVDSSDSDKSPTVRTLLTAEEAQQAVEQQPETQDVEQQPATLEPDTQVAEVQVQSQTATSEEQLFDNMITAGGPQPAEVTVIGFTSFSELLPYIEAVEARRAQEAAERARQAAPPDPDDSQGGVVPGSFHTWTPRSDPGDLASDESQPEPAFKATRVD